MLRHKSGHFGQHSDVVGHQLKRRITLVTRNTELNSVRPILKSRGEVSALLVDLAGQFEFIGYYPYAVLP